MIEVVEWPVGTKLVRICGCGAVLQFDQSDILKRNLPSMTCPNEHRAVQTVMCPTGCGYCIVGERL